MVEDYWSTRGDLPMNCKECGKELSENETSKLDSQQSAIYNENSELMDKLRNGEHEEYP